jgi:enoyl-CoA hydratase
MIEVESIDGVRVLRLAHNKASALDIELVEALTRALSTATRERAKALVLTGTGTIFCAGVDLFRVVDGGAGYVQRYLPAFAELMFALFSFDGPLIVAANGHAIAGGAVLVAAGDYRLLARGNARVGYTEHQVGVPFPPAALEVIRFGVPARRIEQMLYGAETYPCDEALALGFVDELVEPQDLLPRACAIANRYASPSREAFAITKSIMRAATLQRMRAAEGQFAPAVEEAWCAESAHAAIRQYLDRTVRRTS